MPNCIFCEEQHGHVEEISDRTEKGICRNCLQKLRSKLKIGN